MFAGEGVVLRFDVPDLVVDPSGDTPMDLDGRTARYSLARSSGGSYSDQAVVDKDSEDDASVATSIWRVSATGAISPGGSGYAVGDVVVAVGGEGIPAAFTVTGVTAGAITAVSIINEGSYSEKPTSPVAVTVDGNATASIALTFAAVRGAVQVTLVEQDTEDLDGTFHEELEIVDASGASRVVATRDRQILRNVRNA